MKNNVVSWRSGLANDVEMIHSVHRNPTQKATDSHPASYFKKQALYYAFHLERKDTFSLSTV